jgi:hypothetical protein
MEALPAFGTGYFTISVVVDIVDEYAREFVRCYQLCKMYGVTGVPLFIFGNRTIWRMQAQILGELKDEDALAFKESVYNECTMIAVSVSSLLLDLLEL